MTEIHEMSDADLDMVVGIDDQAEPVVGMDPDLEERISGRISEEEMSKEIISPSGAPQRARTMVDDAAAENDAFAKFAKVDTYRQERAVEEGIDTYELFTGERAKEDETLEDEDDTLLERKPEQKGEARDIDAAITLLKKHKAPDSVLDRMEDGDVIAWAEELKPVHAANQNAHRELSQLRTGKEESPRASEDAASEGSPARIDLKETRSALTEEMGEEVGGKLADTLQALSDDNAALRKQVSGIAKVSDSEAMNVSMESLATTTYPQLESGSDGWRDARTKVRARAKELAVGNKATGRYRNYADLLSDAALLELGAPERSSDPKKTRERAIHRLRDQGQPRERRSRSASRFGNEGITNIHDDAYNSFRRKEAELARGANYID